MKTLHKLILGLGLVLPMLAAAQWQWLDKDGRKVFSDRPPPVDVPPEKILKQPSRSNVAPGGGGAAQAAAGAAGQPAAKAPSAGAVPKLSGKDKELEERKKKAEAEVEAKRLAEEQRIAKARADNCARAQRAKATYESGVRIARTGASGQREILDDAARAAELQRFEDVIRKDCAD